MTTIAAFRVPGRLALALCLLALFVAGVAGGLLSGRDVQSVVGTGTPSGASAGLAAVRMLRDRFSTLLDGDLARIRGNYDLDSYGGLAAWDKERSRTAYLRAWLSRRGVGLTEASAWFEIDHVSSWDRDAFRLEITEHATYAYSQGETQPPHRFGSRTVHVMVLLHDGGQWQIQQDWYLDPLGDYPGEPGEGPITVATGESQAGSSTPGDSWPGLYDREKAVSYAVRYSGVRSIPGGGIYNRAYTVYAYQGGDCANFASQVLAAGGVPQGYGWFNTGKGSMAWLCSPDLVWHLLSSCRGVKLFAGSFEEAMKPTGRYPGGPVAGLEPGDLVAYQVKGEIAHVAVVTGHDPYGYPLIASHTSDRLAFPWDLGWGKGAVFWFIHVVY